MNGWETLSSHAERSQLGFVGDTGDSGMVLTHQALLVITWKRHLGDVGTRGKKVKRYLLGLWSIHVVVQPGWLSRALLLSCGLVLMAWFLNSDAVRMLEKAFGERRSLQPVRSHQVDVYKAPFHSAAELALSGQVTARASPRLVGSVPKYSRLMHTYEKWFNKINPLASPGDAAVTPLLGVGGSCSCTSSLVLSSLRCLSAKCLAGSQLDGRLGHPAPGQQEQIPDTGGSSG